MKGVAMKWEGGIWQECVGEIRQIKEWKGWERVKKGPNFTF